MSGTSTKTQVVTIRLSNEVITKIQQALEYPRNHNISIGDYCKEVVEHWAFRHDKQKLNLIHQFKVSKGKAD